MSNDLNANGIPDECDIASGTSQDCNGNGFPDECDIASGISQDANGNGIPDRCEQQGQGGGGTLQSGTQSAWTEFHNWTASQAWGPNAPTTPAEQFQAYVDKLEELDLPCRRPEHAGGS